MEDTFAPCHDLAAHAVGEGQVLSGRMAVLRSGEHLARIAQGLRDLETVLIARDHVGSAEPAQHRRARRTRLQALDLMIQELTGLSDILIGAASHLSDQPDGIIDALVELPRLQSLSRALRGREAETEVSSVVVF